METYETSATVEDRGQVRVAGVPFAPGTEVEVMISPKVRPGPGSPHPHAGSGLRWQGNVLVHQGAGSVPPIVDSRDERLGRLAEGLPG
jgi:hypothetical protein